MENENISAESVVESQPTEDVNVKGLNLETASDEAANIEDKSQTKKYSERLNKDREAIREELRKEYEPALTEAETLKLELQALKEGRSVDEIKAEKADEDSKRQELLANDPRIKEAEQVLFQKQYDELLGSLQKEFPDDNITKLEDLDPDFFKMLHAGANPAKAYKVCRDELQAKQPAKKETPGSVKSEETPAVKNFTRDEVKGMSDAEVMANYDAIMEAKKKW